MKKWEYKTVTLTRWGLDGFLNIQGQEGWEVVAIIEDQICLVTFKRPLPEPSAPATAGHGVNHLYLLVESLLVESLLNEDSPRLNDDPSFNVSAWCIAHNVDDIRMSDDGDLISFEDTSGTLYYFRSVPAEENA